MYVALEKRIGLKGENARLRANPLSLGCSENLCHQGYSKMACVLSVLLLSALFGLSRQPRSSPSLSFAFKGSSLRILTLIQPIFQSSLQ